MALSLDPDKFEMIHQVGGIRTGRYDWPDAGGSSGGRVAFVNAGAGLRFTVALDRGGDIVEAFYQEASLAYLTPNGYQPTMRPVVRDDDWLAAWPGGLVTTCGPRYMGPGRVEDGLELALHGHHSNTPAALIGITNPNPRMGEFDMQLEMLIRDTQMYGPNFEVRRRISCTLGTPTIRLQDTVTNIGNARAAHNWLYHLNFGYPLLDKGSQIVYGGIANGGWMMNADMSISESPHRTADLEEFLQVPDPLPVHAAAGSRGLVVDVHADGEGISHCGLINGALGLAVEVAYPASRLPRLANWQHYGPGGAYVCALEPFSGSLFGKEQDDHPLADQQLEAGESKSYDLSFVVHTETASIEGLKDRAGTLVAVD